MSVLQSLVLIQDGWLFCFTSLFSFEGIFWHSRATLSTPFRCRHSRRWQSNV